GSVAVSGDDALLECAAVLSIGKLALGTLAVADGGRVSCPHAFIGQQAGSQGSVTVTDIGSILDVSDALDVGSGGHGTLSVLGGAVLSHDWAAIGTYASDDGVGDPGVGEVTASGPASVWLHSGDLYVGYLGHGTLNVLDGALVTAHDGYVALQTI